MEKSLVRKQDIRLIPLCAIVYLLCFLDRANIGVSCISDLHSCFYIPSVAKHDAKISFKEMRKYSTAKAAMISCRLPRLLHTNTGKTERDDIIHTWLCPELIYTKKWHVTRSITLTVFYITYSIFEVPSNLCLKRFGPSVRIACIQSRLNCNLYKFGELANTLFF